MQFPLQLMDIHLADKLRTKEIGPFNRYALYVCAPFKADAPK